MSEKNTVSETIKMTAPRNYTDINFQVRGGTRDIFFAKWGPSKETRVLKVDRTENELDTPRARRHVQRGYNTSHERRIAGILQSGTGHPNLNRLVDYWELPDGRAVNVYEHFPGETLEETVKQRPLTEKEFVSTFRDVIAASRYMTSQKKVAHRDKKPSNILVNRKGITEGAHIIAQITDFANGEELAVIGEKEAQALPTVGGHLVTDPRLMEKFTGTARKYNVQDEIFQDCADMLFAFHGKHPFEYDADNGIGINHLNGEPLLTEDGKLDERRYEAALEMSLKKVPRKFRSVIRKGMTGNLSNRHKSLDDLAVAFDQASKPRHWPKVIGTLGLAAGILFGVSIYNSVNLPVESPVNKKGELIGDPNDVIKVVSAVNGEGLEVGNNLFDMNLRAFVETKGNTRAILYPEKTNHLVAEPGDKIMTDIDLTNKPSIPDKHGLTMGVPSLTTRVYFEGSEGKLVRISPNNFNRAVYMEVGFNPSPTVIVPKEAKHGNYRLIVEVYPPTADEKYFGQEKFRFMEPNKILARKPVPVRVGKDTPLVTLKQLNLDMPNEISLGNYERWENVQRGVYAAAEIEGNMFESKDQGYVKFSVPRRPVGDPILIRIFGMREGQPVYQTAALVEHFTTGIDYVKHTVPDRNFYKTLQRIMPFPEDNSDK